MGSKNLHLKPFDEATLTKLNLFEKYAEVWIPKFVMTPEINHIHIFDFFSGPGFDQNNISGSPIRLIKKIIELQGLFLKQRTTVTLHLNEFDKSKFAELKRNCTAYISNYPSLKVFFRMVFYNEDSTKLFPELLPIIKEYPSLVYLDQNGVRFISDDFISRLEQLRTTDFLFFVSSSYFKRMGMTKEFQRIMSFSRMELDSIQWSNIHRVIVEKLQAKLKKDSLLQLFPFSIKKGANIYGLIFGATHPAAVNGFLDLCWKENSINGEANFDIDEDEQKIQVDLFGGKKLTKIEKFEIDLRDLILKSKLTNNREVLDYTFRTGNYYREANRIVKDLNKKGMIYYSGRTPGINYTNVFKKKNIISYEVIK